MQSVFQVKVHLLTKFIVRLSNVTGVNGVFLKLFVH